MKRWLSCLLTVLFVCMLVPLEAFALSVSAKTSGDYQYVVKEGKAVITDYSGTATDLVIPNKLDGYTVSAIGDYAFYGCTTLVSVTIPRYATQIHEAAFLECENLEKVTLGMWTKTLHNGKSGIFGGCDKLNAIVVADSHPYFRSIDGVLFNQKKTTLVMFPNGRTGAYVVPKTVVKIASAAFRCSLTSLVVPDSVQRIEEGAFKECNKLKSLTVPFVGRNRAGGDDNYESTMRYMFDGPYTGESVVITDASAIRKGAFSGCKKVSEVVLSDSVIAVQKGAFSGAVALKTVRFMGSQKQAEKITIASGNNLLKEATWTYNHCLHTYATVLKKATLTANGYTYKKCSKCGETTEKETIYKASSVKLSKTSFAYSGDAYLPTVVAKDSQDKTIPADCYTVKCAANCIEIGAYTMTVSFTGSYSGTKNLTFKIVPRAASINTLTAKTKAITVKLNRRLQQSTGYLIHYSTTESFETYTKKWVTNFQTSTVNLSGLQSGKTYYVRVRTYKTVDGVNYYSGWSTVKSVKVK